MIEIYDFKIYYRKTAIFLTNSPKSQIINLIIKYNVKHEITTSKTKVATCKYS